MKKTLFGIKAILFAFLSFMFVILVNKGLMPKYYYNDSWPTTNTYRDFYRLDKNSVDVLFFGSSHAVSSFNPQVIYDTYGIRSYNLGCEQQSLFVTYYWLREALKYQSPEVVVLDTFTFHEYTDAYVYNILNCNETAIRKAMDCMKLSLLKIEAGMNIEKIDSSQSGLSYILTNIRYHTRWKDLGENDYTEKEMIEHGGIKGFSALGGMNEGALDTTFNRDDVDMADAEPMAEIADMYLGKIVDLCDKNEIKLIFVNIPYGESIERYKAVKEYADIKDIPFYDFNEEQLYKEIGYSAENDRYSHPNYKGAEKLSRYIGKLMIDEYNVTTGYDESFDESREVYEHKLKNIRLTEVTDAYEYLDLINDNKYDILAFAPKKIGEYIDDGFMSKWFELGFLTDLRNVPKGNHYCAVKADSVMEKMTSDDLTILGSVRDGKMIYGFLIDTSVMVPQYHKYSMTIDGYECGNKNDGINIVVYDNDYKMIVDKVNINTALEEKTMTRY